MATIYVDFTSNSGAITGTWTFTNGSTSVTGVGGAAISELAGGNYIRQSDGTQWYQVTVTPVDNNIITIAPAFQQATHTDDLNATLKNAKTGTGIADAYCHINRATTDTVRSAGDIIKVRANQTHVYAGINITFDESGTVNNYITLKGCSVSDDPWGDASDVKPIIDFSDTNFYVSLSRDYWKFQRFEGKQSNGSYTAFLYIGIYAGYVQIDDCKIHDCGTGVTHYGASVNSSCARFNNCEFYSNFGSNLVISISIVELRNCVINGGAGVVAPYGIAFSNRGGIVYLYDTTFGVSSAHATADINMGTAYSNIIYGRNVILNSVTEISAMPSGPRSAVYIEDDEQTKLANRAWYFSGNIERGAADVGGVTHWLKGTPNSNCGVEQSLELFKDLPLWLPASAKTITVSMRASGWAANLPSNTECYIELKYYDGASATRGTAASTEAFAANDTWTNFTVTITPNSEGPAYLSAYLKKYVAAAFVYVNVATLPTIT